LSETKSFCSSNPVLCALADKREVCPFRMFTEVGGLVSYGSDLIDNYRRTAAYADRILKGAKPNELPVQAPISSSRWSSI